MVTPDDDVVVTKQQDVAFGHARTSIARCRRTPVVLGHQDGRHTSRFSRSDYLRGSGIAARVVHHDELKPFARMLRGDHRIEQLHERIRPAARGYDDADAVRRHGDRPSSPEKF
jgi:hypothetical protein